MTDPRWLGAFAMLIVLSVTVWLLQQPAEQHSSFTDELSRTIDVSEEPILPIVMSQNLDSATVSLGEALFNETRLSADNSISCAHCHNLDQGGVDGLPRSFGVKGEKGGINTPTVFNAALNLAQFWDGRATTLEEQIDGPVQNPKEMGSRWPDVVAKLNADADYVQRFQQIYGDGISAANIRDAIATFERSLITINSRFDRYLRGDDTAISVAEKKGYELFKAYGCVACHQGANVGGNMFQQMGVMREYFVERGNLTDADNGRSDVTGLEEDRHFFKVPSLRLAVLTAPYFHDASASTLEQAIATMAKYQLGRNIPDEDVASIIGFLHTLPGEYRGKALLP